VKESGEGNAYLEANFDSIRNRLRESLVYPKIARKLGLSGEVIVSFLVLPNGTVQDVRIKKSCGIAVLDGSAMQTIENACPFPGPPAVARIVIPIIFQLKSTHPSS
jgi:protein TonB